MSRYQQLALQLQEQISSGVWQEGDKLPSLRETVRRSGLSLMTVFNAYQLLESQGWVRSRPKSGYFVAPALQAPRYSSPLQPAETVDINAFIFNVLQAGNNPDCVALGSAFPDPSLFPQHQLSLAP